MRCMILSRPPISIPLLGLSLICLVLARIQGLICLKFYMLITENRKANQISAQVVPCIYTNLPLSACVDTRASTMPKRFVNYTLSRHVCSSRAAAPHCCRTLYRTPKNKNILNPRLPLPLNPTPTTPPHPSPIAPLLLKPVIEGLCCSDPEPPPPCYMSCLLLYSAKVCRAGRQKLGAI